MRLRFFALLILPTLAVVTLTAALVADRNQHYGDAQSSVKVAALAEQVARLDKALGDEALVAAQLVAPTAGGQQDDVSRPSERFRNAARSTDEELAVLNQLLDDNDFDVGVAVAASTIEVTIRFRPDVTSRQISPLQVNDRYTRIRNELIRALTVQASLLQGADGQQRLLGLLSLIDARGEHLNERLVVELALTYRQWAPGQHSQAIASPARHDQQLEFALIRLEGARQDGNRNQGALVLPTALVDVRQQILVNEMPDIEAQQWRDISDVWLDRLTNRIDFEQRQVQATVETAVGDAERARQAAVLLVAGLILVALISTGVVAYRLVRRLSILTEQVRRMADGRRASPTFADVGGNDEIGHLARAFDEMILQVENREHIQAVEAITLDAIAQGASLDDVLSHVIDLFGVDQAGQPLYRFVDDVSGDGGLPDVVAVDPENTRQQPSSASRRTALSLVETARKRSEDSDQLAWQANHDDLTGLLNRGAIVDQLMLAGDRRNAPPDDQTTSPFGLLHVDLDHFKQVNDTHGHLAGDQLLAAQAQRLNEVITRVGGTVGRFGGDEFLALVPNVSSPKLLARLADRLVQEMSKPISYLDVVLQPSVSIGAAVSRPGVDPRALFNEADQALYEAKGAGRGRAEVSNPDLRNRALVAGQAREAVRTAISHEQLQPWYQPIWADGGRRLAGFEALSRWHHPHWGLVKPGRFLPIAEDLNLMPDLDANLFTLVCRDVTAWLDSGHLPGQIHVNMSTEWLEQDTVVEQIEGILATTRCPARLIVFEVTESGLMTDKANNVRRLHRLRRLGVRIAVDDFGQGHSSLAYLRDLPLDILKIDRRFVTRVESDTDNQAIVGAVLSLAASFDLTVVVEGLERSEELAYLQAAGADLYQGFLLGEPSPRVDTTSFLGRGRRLPPTSHPDTASDDAQPAASLAGAPA